MAVKIRLTRRGRKKRAMYDVIVADSRSPRDGKFIEKLGTYVPLTVPATIELNESKALEWLMKGAQPTETVRRILSYKGVMLKKHLQVGVLKGAITQEQADQKFDEWLKQKDAAINKHVTGLARKKDDIAKAKLEAEKKVNVAKAEALRQKFAVAEPESVQVEVEEAPEVGESATAEVSEEVVSEVSEVATEVEPEKITVTEVEASVEEVVEDVVSENPAAETEAEEK